MLIMMCTNGSVVKSLGLDWKCQMRKDVRTPAGVCWCMLFSGALLQCDVMESQIAVMSEAAAVFDMWVCHVWQYWS